MKTLARPPRVNTERYSLDPIIEGKINKVTLRRRFSIIAALIVLAAAIAVAIVLATRSDHASSKAAVAPTSAPGSVASAAPTRPASSTPAVVPSAAPPDVTWSLFQGVALPSSKTDGPTLVSGPLEEGYADTPTGALIAAAQIDYRYLITPSPGWRRVLSEQVLPGQVRDNFVAQRTKVSDAPPDDGYAQIAGFQFVTFDTNAAVISLVTRSSAGALEAANVTVRWVNGDWRLEFPQASVTPQPIRDLIGYVPWQGVS